MIKPIKIAALKRFLSVAAGDLLVVQRASGETGGIDVSEIDGGGGGDPLSVFSFCQYRNTDDTTNINTANPSAIPFGGSVDAASSDFTATSSAITVNFDGVVNVQAHISQETLQQRTNVGVVITRNNVAVSGVGQSGYIRSLSGHNTSSSHIAATFAVLSGDIIRIFSSIRGNTGVVTQILGESQVTVERRS